MGKLALFFILSQLAANGWWYVSTQQATVGETPFILIPAISSAVMAVMILFEIFQNWDM